MSLSATVRGRRPSPAAGADVTAPAAGTTAPLGHGRHAEFLPSRAASWPSRATCGQLVAVPGADLAYVGCILPPHTTGTCLPAPGQAPEIPAGQR